MKARLRSVVFAVLFLVCASLSTKSFASYESASNNVYFAQYYQAGASQNGLYSWYYFNANYTYYAYLNLNAAQSSISNAYYDALAAYIIGGELNGYYAQLYAYYAWSYTYSASTYVYYVWLGYDYTALAINSAYYASYYTALAALYAGRAS